MKRILNLESLACFSLLIFALATLTGFGQTLQNEDLTNQRIELSLSNVTVSHALMTLAVEHRVSLGLEHSSLDEEEPKLKLDVKNGKLKDVLDLIVKQAPFYRWELRNGVINFVPTQGRDPFLEKLLNTRISRFAPEKRINKFELRNTLADLPEVRSVLESANITVIRVSDYAYRSSIYSNKDVDLSVSDTDVRGVLNKIARDSEHNLWFLGWSDKSKKTLAMGF